MTNYFITGATGFIGGRILSRLLEKGESVHALVRKAEDVESFQKRGVTVTRGDLSDESVLAQALADSEVVIHCAAEVRPDAGREAIWAANVESTGRLARAVPDTLRRFIYMSSGAVYGFGPAPIREGQTKNPEGLYGQSKWAAEKILWRHYTETGLPLVVLRPCTVLGRSSEQFWDRIDSLLQRPLLPFPGGGRALFDLVHVDDLVDATLAAVDSDKAVGQAYNITDGETHTYREIINIYAKASGRDSVPRILPIPSSVTRGVTALITRSMRRRGRSEADISRVGMLNIFDQDLHYSIDAAQRDLSYEPKVTLQQALNQMRAKMPTNENGEANEATRGAP